MSYQQFQQECRDCHKRWNAAFGIVGTTQIAAPPTKCPHCGSTDLTKIADRWQEVGALRDKPEAVCLQCDELQSQLQQTIQAADKLAEALHKVANHPGSINVWNEIGSALAQYAALKNR